MLRWRTGTSLTCAPRMKMPPLSGVSNPAMSRSTVVLPLPLGPSSATNSPSVTLKLMSSSALTRP